MTNISELLGKAANLIRNSDAILITAGAGFGVDSGLPDFRGQAGFWKAYPALAKAGVSFMDVANPQHFDENPRRAWGFYGHRLNLYRQTVPHTGFSILKNWADKKQGGGFVLTSNVDGQFQKAGFEQGQIFEIHGSIHHLQCTSSECRSSVWPADDLQLEVDEVNCLLLSPLPKCTQCGSLLRPNILMFDDGAWKGARTFAQQHIFETWMAQRRAANHRVVTIELGAGTHVATVRWQGEHLPHDLVRINPQDEEMPRFKAGVGLRLGALEALQRLDRLIEHLPS